jgi:hypothetical protein
MAVRWKRKRGVGGVQRLNINFTSWASSVNDLYQLFVDLSWSTCDPIIHNQHILPESTPVAARWAHSSIVIESLTNGGTRRTCTTCNFFRPGKYVLWVDKSASLGTESWTQSVWRINCYRLDLGDDLNSCTKFTCVCMYHEWTKKWWRIFVRLRNRIVFGSMQGLRWERSWLMTDWISLVDVTCQKKF